MGEYRQQNTDSSPINFYCSKNILGKTDFFNVISGKLLLEQHSHLRSC